jgi:predicted RNA binding protein YcfA (HicA-like mRNA interferase family)
MDIDSDNVENAVPSLIHLGLCPPSFLDMFEWEYQHEVPFEKASGDELARILEPELKLPLELDAGHPETIEAAELPEERDLLELDAGYPETVEATRLPPKEPIRLQTISSSPLHHSVPLIEPPCKSAFLSKGSYRGSLDKKSKSAPHSSSIKTGLRIPTITTKPTSLRTGAGDESTPSNIGTFSGSRVVGSASSSCGKKSLSELVEELNNLMVRGSKKRHVLPWLEGNGFEYKHHTGSHAIYSYGGKGHISVPDRMHISVGVLRKLRSLIKGAFENEGSAHIRKRS